MSLTPRISVVVACFDATALHALAIPPYLVSKRSTSAGVERAEREAARREELAFFEAEPRAVAGGGHDA